MVALMVLGVGLLLVAAMALGAIVSLRVARSTQADCASTQQYSKDVMSLAIESLASQEMEITRSRSLGEMAKQIEALNLTVGQLYLQSKISDRTVLSKPLQHGEVQPGSAGVRQTRTQSPLPPEGLVDPETKGTTPAATQVRAVAFAEPT